jgi:hypothetical protein
VIEELAVAEMFAFISVAENPFIFSDYMCDRL